MSECSIYKKKGRGKNHPLARMNHCIGETQVEQKPQVNVQNIEKPETHKQNVKGYIKKKWIIKTVCWPFTVT